MSGISHTNLSLILFISLMSHLNIFFVIDISIGMTLPVEYEFSLFSFQSTYFLEMLFTSPYVCKEIPPISLAS